VGGGGGYYVILSSLTLLIGIFCMHIFMLYCILEDVNLVAK
jgi:hypothetical protein